MSTYRNDTFGFEIDLPDDWKITSGISHLRVFLANTINQANVLVEFSNGRNEFLNIVVERMQPEIPPDINEMIFTLNALEMKYSDLRFGRITVGGREHVCVGYIMNSQGWLKKYLIVLNGYGYALTASCSLELKSLAREEAWDRIATSLRLLKPMDESIITYNNLPQVKHTIEMLRQDLKQQLIARRP